MTARQLIIAAAALGIGASASAADPSKPNLPESVSPPPSHDLVLASTDLRTSDAVTSSQPGAQARRRTARVTTCRCGDPQPQAESDNADSQ